MSGEDFTSRPSGPEFRIIPRGKQPWPDVQLPEAPPWRRRPDVECEPRTDVPSAEDASSYHVTEEVLMQVDAAIHLRRPLLVTGKPGTGKSSLARMIAYRLGLKRMLTWSINSRSTRQDGLYDYDALRRVEDPAASDKFDFSRYLRLGPMGTAMLPSDRPRVLLIDEIDKSDIDLPNDLLHVLEEGEFYIPELGHETEPVSIRPVEGDGSAKVKIFGGRVRCKEFPIVVMTSNGEREFPPAFRRRCICVTLKPPQKAELREIVRNHFKDEVGKFEEAEALIDIFVKKRANGVLATDQLLNALHVRLRGGGSVLDEVLLRSLTDPL